MPSSTWVPNSTVGDIIHKQQPKTVLDIGPGFGKWGFLAREILDIFKGRYKKETWRTHITCYEIFPDYITPIHHYIYDEIVIDCALRQLQLKERYFDLVIVGDVLEHFDKTEGKKLIDYVYRATNKMAIFLVPIGSGYPQGVVLGNKFEEHKSIWEMVDFKNDFRFTRVTTVRERIKSRQYAIALMGKK